VCVCVCVCVYVCVCVFVYMCVYMCVYSIPLYMEHVFCAADLTEELHYKYVLVELFGAGCLPIFTTILQVHTLILSVFSHA